ncbi:MAG: hypothetical protein V3V46_08620 [Anaerolineales bacterium]
MYHPYQNLEAKRIVKERRQTADMARRSERARADRTSLLSSLRAKLDSLLGRPLLPRMDSDPSSHHAAIRNGTGHPRRSSGEAI